MAEYIHTLTYRRPVDRSSITVEQVSWDDMQANKGTFDEWLQETYGLGADTLKSNGQWDFYYAYLDEYRSFYDADKSFTAHLRVYRLPGRKYTPVVSHGTLGDPEVHEENYAKIRSISQTDRIAVDGVLIGSVSWDDGPRKQSGEIMSPVPAATIVDDVATLSEKVAVGEAGIDGIWHYDLYKIVVPPRELTDDEKNSDLFSNADLYRSIFYAFYDDDQAVSLQITPPELTEGNGGINLEVIDPDDDEAPRRVIPMPFNYCNGDPVENFTFRAGGVAVPAGESILLQPGTTAIRTTGDGIADTAEDSLENNDTVTF